MKNALLMSTVGVGIKAYFEEQKDNVTKEENDPATNSKILASLLSQILDAIMICARKNVYHGDLRPGNIVVCNGAVVIID